MDGLLRALCMRRGAEGSQVILSDSYIVCVGLGGECGHMGTLPPVQTRAGPSVAALTLPGDTRCHGNLAPRRREAFLARARLSSALSSTAGAGWAARPSWEGARKDQGTDKQSLLCNLQVLLAHWQCGCILKPAGLTAGQFGGAEDSPRPAVPQSSFNSSRQGHY